MPSSAHTQDKHTMKKSHKHTDTCIFRSFQSLPWCDLVSKQTNDMLSSPLFPPLSFLMCACVKWHAVSFQLTLSLAGALTSSGRTPFPQDSLQQGSLSAKALHTQTHTHTEAHRKMWKSLCDFTSALCAVSGWFEEWESEGWRGRRAFYFSHLTDVCVCVCVFVTCGLSLLYWRILMQQRESCNPKSCHISVAISVKLTHVTALIQ